MYETDKCVVAQGLKVVVIINLIIADHSRMIQAFRLLEISNYDDGGQLTTAAILRWEAVLLTYPSSSPALKTKKDKQYGH